MRWIALRADGKVVEHFDAPTDREIARAVAWSKWGTTVGEVVSAADYAIREEERKAMERNRRLQVTDSEADEQC